MKEMPFFPFKLHITCRISYRIWSGKKITHSSEYFRNFIANYTFILFIHIIHRLIRDLISFIQVGIYVSEKRTPLNLKKKPRTVWHMWRASNWIRKKSQNEIRWKCCKLCTVHTQRQRKRYLVFVCMLFGKWRTANNANQLALSQKWHFHFIFFTFHFGADVVSHMKHKTIHGIAVLFAELPIITALIGNAKYLAISIHTPILGMVSSSMLI